MIDNKDVQKYLRSAIEAAEAGAQIQKEYLGKKIDIKLKGDIDLVTEVDIRCEEVIKNILMNRYPDHLFVAEEAAEKNGVDNPKSDTHQFAWVVDPLDGTTNFAHGFPVYCSSVALCMNGLPVAGAVADPTRDETFSAGLGLGAFLNGEPISVSPTKKLISSLLATGFPYGIKTEKRNNLAEFGRVVVEAQAIRRPGAAALDLCYVAAGRLEGFWEFHLRSWDMAAGALIVAEAGGKVSMSDGADFTLSRSDIVATNGHIHDELLALLKEETG